MAILINLVKHDTIDVNLVSFLGISSLPMSQSSTCLLTIPLCCTSSPSASLASLCHTRQITRATHVRNRVCPRVELILKIIIILLIIFLGFIKSKPCSSQTIKVKKKLFPARGLNSDPCTPQERLRAELLTLSYPAELVMPFPIKLFICGRAVIDCGGLGHCCLRFFSRIKNYRPN